MKNKLLLSITFVILYISIWPLIGLGLAVFICLIPVLFLTDNWNKSAVKLTLVLISLFFVANSITIYWLYKMTIPGGIIASAIVSFLQSVPFLLRHFTKNNLLKNLIFVSAFLCIEGIQLYAEFSMPMLLLGNGLGSHIYLIQWYELTGVMGGTLWILITNLCIYYAIKQYLSDRKLPWKQIAPTMISIILPVTLSIALYSVPTSRGTLKAVILHPSVDCYNEKYLITPEELVNKYMRSLSDIDLSETDVLLWPENAITDMGWISDITSTQVFHLLRDELGNYHNLNLISGAIIYDKAQASDPYSNFSSDLQLYFVAYNAAINMNFSTKKIDIRSKLKLVPFEEYKPKGLLYSLLSPFYSSLGGFSFSKNRINNHDLFEIKNQKILSLICYEILYGHLINTLSSGKVNGITLHMNEGWLNNTHSSRHFQMISQIRAIEQRKSVIVTSNGGISSIIAASGEIIVEETSKSPSVLQGKLELNKKRTFYSQFGDIILKLAMVVFLISMPVSIIRNIHN